MNIFYALKKARFALIGLIVISLLWFWFCLPTTLFDTPYSTVLKDDQGELLGAKIASDEQWRFPEIDTVPERFKTAIIAYEDRRFYQHHGVDPLALSRAIYTNLTHQRIVSGASTLSMQVIRMSSGNPKRNYGNKLKETLRALRLETRYDKETILALYANHAPFGGNVVGLEAAAWRYFGRSAHHLSWAETAMLAVLPNQPSLIHISRNRDRLKEKRDALLTQLHEQGQLTDIDYQLALLEPIPAKPKPLPQYAPHLFDTLQQANPGSHSIDTTVNRSTQLLVQEVMNYQREILLNKGIHNAAILVIDHRTMQIKAYVGNTRWQSTGDEGYALDLVHAKRSTGSILKPFLYTMMIQNGFILPHTLVQDRPTMFKGYRPQNYDQTYRGAVPASHALTQSLNIPAVRMLSEYGVEPFYDVLKTLGMSTLFRSPDEYGLPLILGGAEITLWDITEMYANLAAISQAPRNQANLQTIQIQPNLDSQTQVQSPYSPGAAWVTLNTLLDVKRPGLDSHWRRFGSSQNISWKTGTSYGLRDGWAVGNNGQHTVGVWVGNASGEGNTSLTGLSAAAPLMFDTFDRLGRAPWLEKPSGSLKTVTTCADDGYLANGHCRELEVEVPENSHFEQASSYHKTVHLDADQLLQVHNDCESVNNMRTVNWFVLPPTLEYYYQRTHDEYKPLPPYREDCVANNPNADNPIGLIYPDYGTEVYIPVDVDGKKSAVIFEAVHRQNNMTLYWHLDQSFLAQTHDFHQVAVNIEPGRHTVTLVDENGMQLQRSFIVLGTEK